MRGTPSEQVLQSHLHDAWISRTQDLAKRRTGKSCVRKAGIDVVRHVEYLGAELQRMAFAQLELSGDAHIDPDAAGCKVHRCA